LGKIEGEGRGEGEGKRRGKEEEGMREWREGRGEGERERGGGGGDERMGRGRRGRREGRGKETMEGGESEGKRNSIIIIIASLIKEYYPSSLSYQSVYKLQRQNFPQYQIIEPKKTFSDLSEFEV